MIRGTLFTRAMRWRSVIRTRKTLPGALAPSTRSKPRSKANTKPVGQWNEYEITCIGQDYSVRMNGELVMTWTDPKQRSRSGYIGLQNYNDGKTVRHRNVRIKELPLNK